jgi:hypothetical protein
MGNPAHREVESMESTIYWTVQREVEHDAVWRDGQLIAAENAYRTWRVSICHTTDDRAPGVGGTDNVAESYAYASSPTRKTAMNIARMLAGYEGGVVVELPGILKDSADPNEYDADMWM